MGTPEMFTRFPVLETPRLSLRQIVPRDAEALFAFAGAAFFFAGRADVEPLRFTALALREAAMIDPPFGNDGTATYAASSSRRTTSVISVWSRGAAPAATRRISGMSTG